MTAFLHTVIFAFLFYRFMTDADFEVLADHYWSYQRDVKEVTQWYGMLGAGVIVLILAAQLIVMAAALRVYRQVFIFQFVCNLEQSIILINTFFRLRVEMSQEPLPLERIFAPPLVVHLPPSAHQHLPPSAPRHLQPSAPEDLPPSAPSLPKR